MRRGADYANVAVRASVSSWLISSANHLVRLEEEGRGDSEAKGFGGLEVDDQLELHWPFDGQRGGVGAFEDFVHVDGSTPKAIQHARVRPKNWNVFIYRRLQATLAFGCTYQGKRGRDLDGLERWFAEGVHTLAQDCTVQLQQHHRGPAASQ
jgi:hypothetical protein